MSIKQEKGEQYRALLVERIRAAAKDLDEMAPDLVGNTDLISNFEITLSFSQDSVPCILLCREHIAKRSSQVFYDKEVKGE